MFGRRTIYLLGLLLVIALMLRQEVLALLTMLMLLTAGLARLWSQWALRRLTYTRELSQRRALPGDSVTLTLHMANRKLLSIPFLQVMEQMPRGLKIEGKGIGFSSGRGQFLSRTTDIRWYEQVSWQYQVHCTRRGVFAFGSTTLEAGDPFGFYETTRSIPAEHLLLIFPRPLPLEELRLPAHQPIGTLQARALLRDPLRTVGVREYQRTDPFRDIHWNATARTGTLQTRIYEATTERSLAIFLDVDSFERYWEGIDPEQSERLISAAATIIQAADREGYAIGLYSNGAATTYPSLICVPPHRSPAHTTHLMEALAHLNQLSVMPMHRLLSRQLAALPTGTSILLISAIAPAEMSRTLASVRQQVISWLFLGEQAPQMPRIYIHHVPPTRSWKRNHA